MTGEFSWAVPELAGLSVKSTSEIPVSTSFHIEISPEIGKVESLVSGNGPVIVHIQEAHGNDQVQKNIQTLLQYLHDHYGFNLLLIEGGAFKLQPERVRTLVNHKDVTREVLDELVKEEIAKGDELFLADQPNIQAYGIEDLPTYVANSRVFREVLVQQEKTKKFLKEMHIQIKRLTSAYLNDALRQFLERLEDYESNLVSFEEWLNELKRQAQTELDLNLTDPANQMDWPMLLRLFKLKEIESELDMGKFEKEKEEFLKEIEVKMQEARGKKQDNLYKQIQRLLLAPVSQSQLPDPETGILFEQMVSQLPEDFNYQAYPNVNLFIGHLILQSEIKGDRLMNEVEVLEKKISSKLAKTEEEKKLLELLKNYRLLKKLFALELTPSQYSVLSTQYLFKPVELIQQFTAINQSNRVRNLEFQHLDEIGRLYDKAMEFYRGAKARDELMLKNVVSRMNEIKAEKAIVITGGFHSGPFEDYFVEQGYNYALLTPKITVSENREKYIQSILKYQLQFFDSSQAALRAPGFLAHKPSQLRKLGFNPKLIYSDIRKVLSAKKVQKEIVEPSSVRSEVRALKSDRQAKTRGHVLRKRRALTRREMLAIMSASMISLPFIYVIFHELRSTEEQTAQEIERVYQFLADSTRTDPGVRLESLTYAHVVRIAQEVYMGYEFNEKKSRKYGIMIFEEKLSLIQQAMKMFPALKRFNLGKFVNLESLTAIKLKRNEELSKQSAYYSILKALNHRSYFELSDLVHEDRPGDPIYRSWTPQELMELLLHPEQVNHAVADKIREDVYILALEGALNDLEYVRLEDIGTKYQAYYWYEILQTLPETSYFPQVSMRKLMEEGADPAFTAVNRLSPHHLTDIAPPKSAGRILIKSILQRIRSQQIDLSKREERKKIFKEIRDYLERHHRDPVSDLSELRSRSELRAKEQDKEQQSQHINLLKERGFTQRQAIVIEQQASRIVELLDDPALRSKKIKRLIGRIYPATFINRALVLNSDHIPLLLGIIFFGHDPFAQVINFGLFFYFLRRQVNHEQGFADILRNNLFISNKKTLSLSMFHWVVNHEIAHLFFNVRSHLQEAYARLRALEDDISLPSPIQASMEDTRAILEFYQKNYPTLDGFLSYLKLAAKSADEFQVLGYKKGTSLVWSWISYQVSRLKLEPSWSYIYGRMVGEAIYILTQGELKKSYRMLWGINRGQNLEQAFQEVANTNQIIEHNIRQIKSEAFSKAWGRESIGGNAGEGYSAVNGIMTLTGHIMEWGNFQDYDPNIQKRIELGELIEFGLRVRAQRTPEESPDYSFYLRDYPIGNDQENPEKKIKKEQLRQKLSSILQATVHELNRRENSRSEVRGQGDDAWGDVLKSEEKIRYAYEKNQALIFQILSADGKKEMGAIRYKNGKWQTFHPSTWFRSKKIEDLQADSVPPIFGLQITIQDEAIRFQNIQKKPLRIKKTAEVTIWEGAKRFYIHEKDNHLEIVTGSQRIVFDENHQMEFQIGRDPSNDFVVNDKVVSKHHFRLRVDPDGVWLRDLRSTNGTYVGSKKLEPSREFLILSNEYPFFDTTQVVPEDVSRSEVRAGEPTLGEFIEFGRGYIQTYFDELGQDHVRENGEIEVDEGTTLIEGEVIGTPLSLLFKKDLDQILDLFDEFFSALPDVLKLELDSAFGQERLRLKAREYLTKSVLNQEFWGWVKLSYHEFMRDFNKSQVTRDWIKTNSEHMAQMKRLKLHYQLEVSIPEGDGAHNLAWVRIQEVSQPDNPVLRYEKVLKQWDDKLLTLLEELNPLLEALPKEDPYAEYSVEKEFSFEEMGLQEQAEDAIGTFLRSEVRSDTPTLFIEGDNPSDVLMKEWGHWLSPEVDGLEVQINEPGKLKIQFFKDGQAIQKRISDSVIEDLTLEIDVDEKSPHHINRIYSTGLPGRQEEMFARVLRWLQQRGFQSAGLRLYGTFLTQRIYPKWVSLGIIQDTQKTKIDRERNQAYFYLPDLKFPLTPSGDLDVSRLRSASGLDEPASPTGGPKARSEMRMDEKNFEDRLLVLEQAFWQEFKLSMGSESEKFADHAERVLKQLRYPRNPFGDKLLKEWRGLLNDPDKFLRKFMDRLEFLYSQYEFQRQKKKSHQEIYEYIVFELAKGEFMDWLMEELIHEMLLDDERNFVGKNKQLQVAFGFAIEKSLKAFNSKLMAEVFGRGSEEKLIESTVQRIEKGEMTGIELKPSPLADYLHDVLGERAKDLYLDGVAHKIIERVSRSEVRLPANEAGSVVVNPLEDLKEIKGELIQLLSKNFGEEIYRQALPDEPLLHIQQSLAHASNALIMIAANQLSSIRGWDSNHSDKYRSALQGASVGIKKLKGLYDLVIHAEQHSDFLELKPEVSRHYEYAYEDVVIRLNQTEYEALKKLMQSEGAAEYQPVFRQIADQLQDFESRLLEIEPLIPSKPAFAPKLLDRAFIPVRSELRSETEIVTRIYRELIAPLYLGKELLQVLLKRILPSTEKSVPSLNEEFVKQLSGLETYQKVLDSNRINDIAGMIVDVRSSLPSMEDFNVLVPYLIARSKLKYKMLIQASPEDGKIFQKQAAAYVKKHLGVDLSRLNIEMEFVKSIKDVDVKSVMKIYNRSEGNMALMTPDESLSSEMGIVWDSKKQRGILSVHIKNIREQTVASILAGELIKNLGLEILSQGVYSSDSLLSNSLFADLVADLRALTLIHSAA